MDERNPLMAVDDQVPATVPDLSSWTRVCHCCGEFSHTPSEPSFPSYCFYWQPSPGMPIFVVSTFVFCYFAFLSATLPRLAPAVAVVSFLESTVAGTMFLWSYLGAVCRDPGYLPFDWAQTQRTKYGWDELMAGTTTTQAQREYVAAVPRPPGCSFSRSSGRYVIRADHICGWIANWVAKRNHKHFILFMWWGALTALSLFGWRWIPQSDLKSESYWRWAVDITATIIEGLFGVVMLLAAPSFCVGVLSATTKLQRMKGEGAVEIGKMDALRQVFGDGSVVAWAWPTDAFGDEIQLDDAPGQGHVG
jgi:hypothetical protein